MVTSHNIGLSDHLPAFVVRKYTRDLSARLKTGSRIKYRDTKHFDLFSVSDISSAQVYTMIMKIGPHKASGIDRISARLLRIAPPVIAPSVAKLINLSFSTCKYPTRWKTAKVTPLFKSGAR